MTILRSSLAWLRAFRRDDNGTIAIMATVFFTIAIASSALVIDAGYLYLERRQAQTAADLAAIAAASDLDNATAAARATLTANRIPNPVNLTVVLGQYVPDTNLAIPARFTPGAMPYNAAQVSFTKPGTLFFAKTFNTDCCTIGVTALGAVPGLATFSVGSRLLAVNNGAINALLKGTLGGNVNLTVMDYNALVGGKVELLDVMNALATELNISAGTYKDVLDASAKAGHILKALARVSAQNGNSLAVSALDKLLLQSQAMTHPINLHNVLGLDPSIADLAIGKRPAGTDAKLSVMDMVSAAAMLSDGTKQVALDLGATVPGLAKVALNVTIGEPMQTSPWAAVGQQGSTVRTSQTKIKFDVEVTAGITVKLPIDIELAYAQGRLSRIVCATRTVTVGAQPGIASAVIGGTTSSQKVDIATIPVPLLGSVAVSAYTPVGVQVGNGSETPLVFSGSDIDSGVIKTASTTSAVKPVAALLANMKLGARLGGLEIPVPALVTSTVGAVLNTATTTLIDQTLFNVLGTLGIHLGQADVIVHGVRCGAALAG